MARSKFDVDVDGVDKTLNKIRRKLHRGMEKSSDTLVRNAKSKARNVISENDAIFNAEVYAGFKDAETRNNPTTVRTKLYNDVDHADALEEGAEYTTKGPPVEALLPWVVRKMDWRPDGGLGDYSGGDGPDGRGGDGDRDMVDEEVVDQDTLDQDTTDDGLTLSSQADDMAINSGDINRVDDRVQRKALFQLDDYQRRHGMPKVESIDSRTHETLEGAFEDTGDTIVIPRGLVDNFDEFVNPFSNYIGENRERFNTNYERHVEYIVDHQYGGYVYDNLSETALNDFRNRWGFTETDSGWELPDDASGYAAEGERQFFSEKFVSGINGEYNYTQKQKEDYFERVENLDEEYFDQTFLDRPTDTVEYSIGHDYSGDREVVRESDLADYGDSFTTDFDNRHYINGDAYHEYSTYVVTSPRIEGARALEYSNEKFHHEGMELSPDEVTLQAIPESHVVYNNMESGDELVVREIDRYGDFTDELESIEVRFGAEDSHLNQVAEGENVFTGDNYEIHREGIIGRREDYPDLWADGVDTIDPITSESDIDDTLVSDFAESEMNERQVINSIDADGHIIIDDSGELHRAVQSDSFDTEFRSKHPNEDGEYLEWEYDYANKESNEISISHLNELVVQKKNVEYDDNVLVDSDALDDPSFTDSVYRATVKDRTVSEELAVVPFGTSSTSTDFVDFDAFLGTRDSLPGWNAHNWDRGRKVTIEKRGEQHTGHLEKTESDYSDSLSYEVDQMIMIDEETGRKRFFYADDVVSSEDDGFMERWEDAPSNIDHSASEWNDWSGEVTTDDLRPSDYEPLEGADLLNEGTEVHYDRSGTRFYSEITRVTDEDTDVPRYVTADTHRIEAEEIEYFDGMGADPDDLEVGRTVSTGTSFGEIVGLQEHQDDDGVGVEVDFNGDGTMDDLLNNEEVQHVPMMLPEDSRIMFWDHRNGEYKTGTYKRKFLGTHRITGEDGIEYQTGDDSLYPITILGYQLDG